VEGGDGLTDGFVGCHYFEDGTRGWDGDERMGGISVLLLGGLREKDKLKDSGLKMELFHLEAGILHLRGRKIIRTLICSTLVRFALLPHSSRSLGSHAPKEKSYWFLQFAVA
jgi:hypothetical protein